MRQSVLITLEILRKLKSKLHSDWVHQGYEDELGLKLELLQKVFACLEETSCGKIKSGIPYERVSIFLIEHAENLSYQELHRGVTKIIVAHIHELSK